jgi:uncharacterized protein YllA (UPF0747 family)
MSNTTVGLSYGILSEPLDKQLDKQELKYNKKIIAGFESEREAINTLRFGCGLLTDGMVDKMLPKLHKKIIAHVAKSNGKSVANVTHPNKA